MHKLRRGGAKGDYLLTDMSCSSSSSSTPRSNITKITRYRFSCYKYPYKYMPMYVCTTIHA